MEYGIFHIYMVLPSPVRVFKIKILVLTELSPIMIIDVSADDFFQSHVNSSLIHFVSDLLETISWLIPDN